MLRLQEASRKGPLLCASSMKLTPGVDVFCSLDSTNQLAWLNALLVIHMKLTRIRNSVFLALYITSGWSAAISQAEWSVPSCLLSETCMCPWLPRLCKQDIQPSSGCLLSPSTVLCGPPRSRAVIRCHATPKPPGEASINEHVPQRRRGRSVCLKSVRTC